MLFLTIILTVFVAAAEMDICVASFPVINDFFPISPFQTEFLLSFNIIANAITAFFAGHLGDKYGKKYIINIGLVIFIIGSTFSSLGNTFYGILFGRVLQGVGAAMPMVLGPLIIIDAYKEEKQSSMMAMLNGISTIGIAFAPAIGSYATLLWGWRSNFTILVVLGIVALVLSFLYLPAEKKVHKNISFSLLSYAQIFRSKLATLYLLALSLSIASYYAFVGMSSIIYVDSLGVSLKHFGIYQGAMCMIFGIFSILIGKITNFFGEKKVFIFSIIMLCLHYILVFWLILCNIKDPLIITSVLILDSIGYVMPINLLYIRALKVVEGSGGRMSALITIGKWIFTAIAIQIASYFYTNDFRSTGIVMTTLSIIAICIMTYLFTNDAKLKKSIIAS